MISPSDFAATLEFLLPGFVLAKIFYAFGLRTRRSDLEWGLWSLLAAAPIRYLAELIPVDADTTLRSFGLAVAGGFLLVGAWRGVVYLHPPVLRSQSVTAWDDVFSGPGRWLQVHMKDGRVFSGWRASAATSLDAGSDVDLLLAEPALVDDGRVIDLPGVQSVLVRREDIVAIYIYRAETGSTVARS